MKTIGVTLQRTYLQKLQKETLCDIQLSSLTSFITSILKKQLIGNKYLFMTVTSTQAESTI